MTTIQLRRDTAAGWTSTNPVLADGELGLEADTGKEKVGDGVKTWTALSYHNDVSAEATARVAGDAAEAASRNTAIADAITAMSGALTAEAAARAAADLLRIVMPSGGADGQSLVKKGSGVEIGTPFGVLSRASDGTLTATISNASGGMSESSMVSGGGFVNCGKAAPASLPALAGVVIAGVDVSGSSISFDFGQTWIAANFGKFDTKHMKSATIQYDPVVPNRVLMVTSNASSLNAGTIDTSVWSGTIDVSNKSLTWTLWWSSVNASSFGAAQSNLGRIVTDGGLHPRQSGDLLVCHPNVPNICWLGTHNGVVKITNSGVTFVGLNGAANTNVITALKLDAAKDMSSGSNIDIYAAVGSSVLSTNVRQLGTDAGIWKIANAEATPTLTKLTAGAPPLQPLGLKCVNESGVNVIYATDAGSGSTTGGVLRYNRAGSASWENMNNIGGSGLRVATTGTSMPNNSNAFLYKSIDAARVGSTTMLVVGHDGQDELSQAKIFYTLDASVASPTWVGEPSVANADVDTTYKIRGTGGINTSFLFGAANGPPYNYYANLYTSSGFDAAAVQLNPNRPSEILAFGRSGVWFFDTAATTPQWQVSSNGLGSVISYAIAAHPTNPKMAAQADSDWTGLDWFDIDKEPTMAQRTSAGSGKPNAVDAKGVAFDDLGYRYLCQAQRNTFDQGRIWRTDAPFSTTGGNSYSELLDMNGKTIQNVIGGGTDVTDFGIRGMIVFRHTDGDLIVIALCGRQIAGSSVSGVASHAGIWRAKIGSVAPEGWTRKDGALNAFQTLDNSFQTFHGDSGHNGGSDANCVYTYEHSKGVLASNDGGNTWRVLFGRLPTGVPTLNRYSGCVACDPHTAGRVAVTVPNSNGGEIWILDGCASGDMNSATGANTSGTASGVKRNSTLVDSAMQAVFAKDGTIWVAQGIQGPRRAAGLCYSVDSGVTWIDDADVRWKNQALLVYGMAISSNDQTIFAACDGAGVVKHSRVPSTITVKLYDQTTIDAKLAVVSVGQPADSDLTQIAAITHTGGEIIQDVGGTWVSRTIAQLKTALGLDNVLNRAQIGRSLIAQTLTGLVPGAGVSTDSAPTSFSLHAGANGIHPSGFSCTATGIVNPETVTVTFTLTFDDAATKTAVLTFTNVNTTQSSTPVTILNAYRDGHYCVGITAKVKSTLAVSAAVVAPSITGMEI